VLDLWTPISRDPLIGFAYIWTCLEALDRVYLCIKHGADSVIESGEIRVQRSGTNFDYYNGILGVVVRIFGTNRSGLVLVTNLYHHFMQTGLFSRFGGQVDRNFGWYEWSRSFRENYFFFILCGAYMVYIWYIEGHILGSIHIFYDFSLYHRTNI